MLNTSQNTMQTRRTLITAGIEPINELTTTLSPLNMDMVLNGRKVLNVRIALIAGKSAIPINGAIMLSIDSLIKFIIQSSVINLE